MFSISAIDAALSIVRQIRENAIETTVAIESLRRGRADIAALDYVEGEQLLLRLDDVVTQAVCLERAPQLRAILHALIVRHPPPWSTLFTRGRESVLAAVDADTQQLFLYAELAGLPLDEDGVDWWDSIAAAVRQRQDADRLAVGRHGERLTLIRERGKLSSSRPVDSIRWVALEDNGAGYDVESWLISASGSWTRKFIEVKACQFLPMQFFLSRHEWDIAVRNPDQYFVHVWFLGDASLVEMSVGDLNAHIPHDRGAGEWKKVLVRLVATAPDSSSAVP